MNLQLILENLRGTHQLRTSSWEQIVELLKSHDIRRIGQGAFGDVFAHPSWNYVVKVFDTDSAYLAFIDFVQQHPNKHYPKIIKSPKQIHQFHLRNKDRSDTHKYFYAVKIERLYDITVDNENMIVDLCLVMKNVYKNHYNKQHVFMDSIRQLASKYPRQDLASLAVAVYKALSHLKSNLPKAIADLHVGNFMQRADGTIVVIDPSTCLNDSDPYFREPLEQQVIHGINH